MAETQTQSSEDNKSMAEMTAEVQSRFWSRVFPPRIHDILLPPDISDQLNPGEEVLLVIYQAWYKNFSAYVLYNYYPIVVILSLLVTSGIAYFRLDTGFFPSWLWNLMIPWLLLLVWCGWAIYENFNYLKWRLVITNNRLVFATPQKDAKYLSDTIQLNGKPKVVDANWSDSDFIRLLQMVTASRDVFISLQGLQFVQGTAKVKDALVMPDVELKKIERLKSIIFS